MVMSLCASHCWWNLRNDGVDETGASLWPTDTPIPHPLGRPQRCSFSGANEGSPQAG